MPRSTGLMVLCVRDEGLGPTCFCRGAGAGTARHDSTRHDEAQQDLFLWPGYACGRLGDWMLAADDSCRSRSCCARDSVCKVRVPDVKWGLGCGMAAGHHRAPKRGTCAGRASRARSRLIHERQSPRPCSPAVLPVWPVSPTRVSVQDAPKLQGRRQKIAKRDRRWTGAHTVHRAASSDNLILGTGRGWTAENKERWAEAECVRGFEVVHQRSVSRMIRHAIRLALGGDEASRPRGQMTCTRKRRRRTSWAGCLTPPGCCGDLRRGEERRFAVDGRLVLVQWSGVSRTQHACGEVHGRQVPPYSLPELQHQPPAGASGLVLWAAPSLLHCELQQRALLGWTRPDWTGILRPRHHRAVLERSLLTRVHDFPHINQTGRG